MREVMTKIKKIITIAAGAPAAFILCSEPTEADGYALQAVALVAVAGVLAINGFFRKLWAEMREYGKQ